jgi:uncharacterized RDD family membrane protein YckC
MTDSEVEAGAPAALADRLLAYALDSLPLLPLFLVLEKPLGPAVSLLVTAALFSAVQAWMLSRWQRTPGKYLFGLIVYDLEGNAPSFDRGVKRALGYWVSAIPLYAGFIAAYFDEDRRAWHDKLSGTVVLEAYPKSPFARRFLDLFGTAAAGLLAAGWLFVWLGLPTALRWQRDARAQSVLEGIGFLQERHREKTGAYARSIEALYPDRNTAEVLDDLGAVFDYDAGIAVNAGEDRFWIRASAKDGSGDIFEISGPPPRFRVIR